MRTSFELGTLRLLSVIAVAASLASSGCGSDHGGGTVNENNQYAPNNYVYVASAGLAPGSTGAVYEYALGADGTLSPLAQPSIAAGINPSALVVVNIGYVYVVNAGDGSISQYNAAADGTLTAMTPATVTNPGMHTLGTTGATATFDTTGNYLYVVNTADDNVAQFSIGGGGQLTPLTPATVATGVAPVSIVASNTGVYVVNSNAAGQAGSVSQYTESADGTLTPTDSSPIAAGTNPSVFAIDEFSPPSFAYVLSNCDGTQCLGSIRQFSVGANGTLTDTGSIVTTGSHYRGVGMVLDQTVSNATAYVLANEMGVDTESSALLSFPVGSSGALTATSPQSLSTPGVAVALLQTIQYGTLYVLTSDSGANANTPATGGSILVYSEGNGGTPTLLGTTTLSAPYPSAIGVWLLLPP